MGFSATARIHFNPQFNIKILNKAKRLTEMIKLTIKMIKKETRKKMNSAFLKIKSMFNLKTIIMAIINIKNTENELIFIFIPNKIIQNNLKNQ